VVDLIMARYKIIKPAIILAMIGIAVANPIFTKPSAKTTPSND